MGVGSSVRDTSENPMKSFHGAESSADGSSVLLKRQESEFSHENRAKLIPQRPSNQTSDNKGYIWTNKGI